MFHISTYILSRQDLDIPRDQNNYGTLLHRSKCYGTIRSAIRSSCGKKLQAYTHKLMLFGIKLE